MSKRLSIDKENEKHKKMANKRQGEKKKGTAL